MTRYGPRWAVRGDCVQAAVWECVVSIKGYSAAEGNAFNYFTKTVRRRTWKVDGSQGKRRLRERDMCHKLDVMAMNQPGVERSGLTPAEKRQVRLKEEERHRLDEFDRKAEDFYGAADESRERMKRLMGG